MAHLQRVAIGVIMDIIAQMAQHLSQDQVFNAQRMQQD
jgi:hypothetical protein